MSKVCVYARFSLHFTELKMDIEEYGIVAEQVLDAAPDAMLIVNEASTIVAVNNAVERLFGYTRSELISKSIMTLIPQRFHSRHEHNVASFIEDPIPRHMGNGKWLFAMRKDGVEFPVEISLSPIKTNKDLLVICAIRDVTERVRVEKELEKQTEELRHSNADLEQFAYIASHDLQEPLRSIASFAQLIERRYKGKLDNDADDFIEFIVEGATRMQKLINDLLSYSRISINDKQLNATDCNSVLRDVLRNLELAIEDSDGQISYDTLPMVAADRSQVVQLFQNLIGNALKFRKADVTPHVKILTAEEGDYIRFTFEDNGIGIGEQYKDRIFTLFQRLHGRNEYDGTGIGLAICKKIVETHGGYISLSSELGKGTTFTFTLPKP